MTISKSKKSQFDTGVHKANHLEHNSHTACIRAERRDFSFLPEICTPVTFRVGYSLLYFFAYSSYCLTKCEVTVFIIMVVMATCRARATVREIFVSERVWMD